MKKWHQRVPLARLSVRAQPLRLVADAEERAALAERFGFASLDRLEATLDLSRTPAGARVVGRLQADVVQSCVVSGQPLPVSVDSEMAVDFIPFDSPGGDEVELSADALDTMAIEDDAIEPGEAVAQSLLLALDPWPRAPDADLVAARAHLLSEEEAEARHATEKAAASPFAVLKRGEK